MRRQNDEGSATLAGWVMVRNSTPDDLDEIIRQRAAVAGEGGGSAPNCRWTRSGTAAMFAGSIERGGTFVAEVDGEIVGVLGMSIPPYLVAELGMHVKDGHRGAGVGSALVERAIEYAREQGCRQDRPAALAPQHRGPSPLREVRLRAGGRAAAPLPPQGRRDLGRRDHGAAARPLSAIALRG